MLAIAVAVAAVAAAVLAGRLGAGAPAPAPRPIDPHAAPPAASQIRALERADGVRLHPDGKDWEKVAASVPDSAEAAQGRLLAESLGRGSHSLYAIPTSTGAVCVALSRVSSGCVPSFPPELPIDWSVGKPDTLPLGQGEPVAIWGIAPDDAVRVQVRVGGELRNAGLEHNAYFFEAADNATAPQAFTTLVVTYRDGTTNTVPVW
jgi:hypothetical protein